MILLIVVLLLLVLLLLAFVILDSYCLLFHRGAQTPGRGRLGPLLNCTGDNWKRSVLADVPEVNFTRAKLRLSRRLQAGAFYGFAVKVWNSETYDALQHDEWRMWVNSPEGYPVDGSLLTLQFNAIRISQIPQSPYDRSWGVYQSDLVQPMSLNFGMASAMTAVYPSSITIINPHLTIYPIGAIDNENDDNTNDNDNNTNTDNDNDNDDNTHTRY